MAEEKTLTILTYNILADSTLHHFKNPNAEELKRDFRTPLIINTLLNSKCDILCLQEVDSTCLNDIKSNLTDYKVVEYSLHENKQFGNCVLAKTNICSDLIGSSHSFNDSDISGRKYNKITSQNCLFTIYNVHLDFKLNCQQINSLVSSINSEEKNVIICGDFNGSPNSTTLRIAKEAGFTTLSTGNTCNVDGNAKVIDFILIKNGKLNYVKTLVDAKKYPSENQGSDHVCVVAEIYI